MSEIVERRLHGIAVYNPDLLSKQELVAQFVARRELFQELVTDLRRPKFKQHQLVVGHRGMGKTTLLRRLRYAVEDDPKLSGRWIALAFPEEQYNVSRLSDLYLNCVDALGDALERTGRQGEADALDEAREQLPDSDEPRRAAAALDLLLGTARRLGRRLLLLIDNLDLILERLNAEQWTIRELLSREDRLLLIGATPFVIGSTYSYDAAFYDFFRVHELRGLTFEETSEVLETLAHEMNAPEVERLVRSEPARIRTLHVLAGGNPRTIVLLFSVLAQGTDGDVRSDLEKLLDQTTPLYKARFESLAPQAQQVVDALAIHWDPISAGELAEKLRLDVNVVSSQLNRLAQQGVVEKVPYDPASKTGFQIAERFFNIWYLMRASRRVRRRLTWLVQFLRLFYGLDQLQLKARDLLRSPSEAMPLRQAEFCLAIAEALGQDRPTQLALESRAIRAMLATDELRREMSSLFDLDGADAGLRPLIDRQTWAREFRATIEAAPDADTAELLRQVGASSDLTATEKLAFAHHLSGMTPEKRETLTVTLSKRQEDLRRLIGSRFSSDLSKAIIEGYISDLSSSEESDAASAALNMPMLAIWPLNRNLPLAKRIDIAQHTNDPLAWVMVASKMANENRLAEAEQALRKGMAGEQCALTRNLGARVANILGQFQLAIAMLGEVSSNLQIPPAFALLANAYTGIGDRRAALETIERGLRNYPNDVHILQSHGSLLQVDRHFADAQQVYEKLIAIDPVNDSTWTNLVIVLMQQEKLSEALTVAERGLARRNLPMLALLRIALLAMLDRKPEAVRALDQLSFAEPNLSETLLALNMADFMMTTISWEAAAALLRLALPRVAFNISDPQIAVASVELFKTAAQHDFAERTAKLVHDLDVEEPLRPFYEALRIHATGNRDALNRLAPELRDPVVQLLDAWQGDASTAKPATKKKRKPTSASKRRRRAL